MLDEKDYCRQRHDDHDGAPSSANGFRQVDEMPDLFHRVDAWALGRHSDAAWVRSVASHRIKLFERTA